MTEDSGEPASSLLARCRRALADLGHRSLASTVIPRSSLARKLAFVALIDALGSGMYLTGSALYLTRIVGLSIAQVGAGLTIGALVGLVGTVPTGMLADRIGAGRLYIIIQVWRGAFFIAYAFIGSFGAFVLVACCVGLADGAMPAVGTAVVAGAADEGERVDTLAKARAARNAGYGIGALLAAVSITVGTKAAFLAIVFTNAASYLVAAAMLVSVGLWSASDAPAKRASITLRTRPRYLLAGMFNAVLAVHMTILTIGLPLWVADYTVAPAGIVGLLVALNTAMSVTLQARFARGAGSVRGALACWVRCGMALALFGAVMTGIHQVHVVWLAVCGAFAAAILLTCGELWQAAGAWKISFDLAEPQRRSQELATFQLGVAIQAVVGPLLIAGAVLRSSYGWLILGGVVLAVSLIARPAVLSGGLRRAELEAVSLAGRQ